MLTKRDYQDALDSQCACNLSGIVRTFSEVTRRIWDEVRANGGGTDDVNRHPICRLYAEQIAFLSGASFGDSETYIQADIACREAIAAFDAPAVDVFEEEELGCPVG